MRKFLQRTATRILNWLRTIRVVRWLSEQNDVVWVTVIRRPSSASEVEFPSLKEFRGLRGILETHENQETKWHFVWNCGNNGSSHQSDLLRRFGTPESPVEQYVIRSAEAWGPSSKRLTTWVVAVGASIAGLAAILTHIDEIIGSFEKWFHVPRLAVASSEVLRVSSELEDRRNIVLYGDPLFRARLIDLSMRIEPEAPSVQAGASVKNVDLPAQRSVDVGGELTITLPFNRVPPGRYSVKLHGKIETEHRVADFAPPPLRLDARARFSGAKGKIQPWPPPPAGTDSSDNFKEALVEIQLLFGQPLQPTLNLRITLDGSWVKWDIVDPLPGGSLERLSQNSPTKPKAVVLGLHNFPAPAFSTYVLRLRLEAQQPLRREDWPKNVGELYVGLLD